MITFPLRRLAAVAAGVIFGAALGYYRECTDGTCPLHLTWWKGALVGAALGIVLSLVFKPSRES